MNARDSQVPTPPTWREYLDARLEPLATKEALQGMHTSLREDLAREIGEVRIEIREAKIDIIKWNIGTMIATSALVWAIVSRLIG